MAAVYVPCWVGPEGGGRLGIKALLQSTPQFPLHSLTPGRGLAMTSSNAAVHAKLTNLATAGLERSTPAECRMPGLLSIFVPLTSGSERADRLKIETLAHRTFGLLGRPSFSHSNIASC